MSGRGHRPAAVAAAMLLLGCAGSGETPAPAARTEPMVELAVVAAAPGFAVEQVEAQVAEPLELALAKLPGVERLTTMVVEGAVELRFRVPAARAEATAEAARAALAETTAALPEEVEPPVLLRRALPAARRAWILRAASADQAAAVAELARVRLLSVAGVSEVELCGGEPAQLVVAVDPGRLAAMALGLDAVLRALGEANLQLPAGQLSGQGEVVIGQGRIRSLDQLQTLVLGVREGVPVYLRDVAQISLEHRADGCRALDASGAQVVLLEARLRDESAGAAVEQAASELAASLPPGASITGLQVELELVAATATDAPVPRARQAAAVASALAEGAPDAAFVLVADAAPRWSPGTWPPESGGPSLRLLAVGLDEQQARAALAMPGVADPRGRGGAVFTLASPAGELPDGPGWWRAADAQARVFTVDRARAAALGLSVSELSRVLAVATSAEPVATLHDGGARINVRVRVGDGSVDALLQLVVKGAPLGTLVRIDAAVAPRARLRENQARVAVLVAGPHERWSPAWLLAAARSAL